ncbi:class I SAM-dependent methyltransferase [Serinicoccus chungangensis]|uniref:class I SAM-dependent methyltransferase n=1 Tax=Serinicoccus chungangensis TaxID=767452 RepID=UPI0009F9AFB8
MQSSRQYDGAGFLYDLVYADAPDDTTFWESVASDAAEILEVGCGTGRVLRQFSTRKIMGLDIDSTMLSWGRQNTLKHQDIPLVAGDAAQLPLADESFDTVIAPRGLLSHMISTRRQGLVANELLRVCRQGGTVAVDVPDLRPYTKVGHRSVSYTKTLRTRTREWTVKTTSNYRPGKNSMVTRHAVCMSEPAGQTTHGAFEVESYVFTPSSLWRVFASVDAAQRLALRPRAATRYNAGRLRLIVRKGWTV